MRDAVTRRLLDLVASLCAIVLSTVSVVLFVLLVVGVPLVAVWIGIPILFAAGAAMRQLAGIYRRGATAILGEQVETPYRPTPPGTVVERLRHILTDPATWRDVLWLLYDFSFGLVISILALVESILDLIIWIKPPGLLLRLHALVVRALLGHSESTRLGQRVSQLTSSRADTIDSSAAELRRIERDLHDGAQARLVALGMNLGLAESQLADDPDAARALVAEARAVSTEALNELRALVRGIHPPVLADRGLDGAVRALALSAPIPVTVSIELPGRLPAPVESAAYFATAEALTNVIKHSAAHSAAVDIVHAGNLLSLRVSDDGHGGATLDGSTGGTGLAGIARRLAAFDGRLEVDSPPGGPTRLAMVLECASFSPKISPSSGTA